MKITQKQIIELLIETAEAKKHKIKIQKGKAAFPHKIFIICKHCNSSAYFIPRLFKEQKYSPWRGSLVDSSICYTPINKPPKIKYICHDYKNRVNEKRQKTRIRNKLKKIAYKIYNNSSISEDEIINILENIYNQKLK